MATLALFSARGGVGVSLLATNLGVALARQGGALLLDMHPGSGCDELLLDLEAKRPWTDLLSVAGELDPRHLELAASAHPSGLRVISAPSGWDDARDEAALGTLLASLAAMSPWLMLDLPPGLGRRNLDLLGCCHRALLVTTADPPALRSAARCAGALSATQRAKTGLVLNQITRRHPASPAEIADSLGLPLWAVLPTDPRAIGYQVNFGQPAALDRRSPYGRAVRSLAARLKRMTVSEMEERAQAPPQAAGVEGR